MQYGYPQGPACCRPSVPFSPISPGQVIETSISVGIFHTARVTDSTIFRQKGQRSRSQCQIELSSRRRLVVHREVRISCRPSPPQILLFAGHLF